MIKELNNKSLAFGIPGLILCVFGALRHFGLVIYIIGSILVIIGLAYYSKSKGYSIWLGLLGLFNLLGIIVLLSLKDQTITPVEKETNLKSKIKDTILAILIGIGLIVGLPLIIGLLLRLF